MKQLLALAALSSVAACSGGSGAPDGKSLFDANCASCHAAGSGHPGTARLAIDMGAENAVLTERKNLSPEQVTLAVRQGFQMMPPFRQTELSDAEVTAIADWLANPSRKN
jgi:(+)-pinoresinol hydroxylase